MFPIFAGNSASTGYNLTRSLRFRASASGYLSRTMTTPTNNLKWTWSGWLKRGLMGTIQDIFGSGDFATTGTWITFNASDSMEIYYFSSSYIWRFITTQKFRDPAAYYHVAVAYDSAQATNTNRFKLYVNGSQVTAFTTADYPALNQGTSLNGSSFTHYFSDTANKFDGYLTEVNFIDGQALTPSSFGSTNALTGVWQPARYTGTYGTNGFYLPFTDNSALTTASNVGLGKDFSGNGNYWTTNNISITAGVTYDSMTDVPTLTSATAANFAVLNPLNPSRSTLTNGNLTASGTTDTPTIIPTSGTYYFEIGGVSTTWTPPAAFPAAAGSYNFGQRPFTNTPTGTLLNTYNLPTSTIVKGNTVMDATLYTGTLLSNAVTNAASFKPDLVWVKSRSAATDNKLTDSVRGVTKGLISNTTAAETTDTQGLTAFGSAGFTVGTDTNYNNLAGLYVAWQWQAGQGSSSSNTNGTITSTVSVNASAGFSIVTFTSVSSGTLSTIGHGLGVAPQIVLVKDRGQTSNWTMYHSAISTNVNTYISLNLTNAASTLTDIWGSALPTSSVFGIKSGTTVQASDTCVAYCWTPIAGYSAFGSYTGNGLAAGPFIYTGFKPKWVMWKRTDVAGTDWIIIDTSRQNYNTEGPYLLPNSASAEGTFANINVLSNGFQQTSIFGGDNASGGTFIYIAFASNPFKNSLAQ